jgi:predicted enzyme related to lactoylglutathione lyase
MICASIFIFQENCPMAGIGPLSMLILFARNMHKQVLFYRDVMGFKVVFPSGVKDFTKERWVEMETGGCRLALHPLTRGPVGRQTTELVFRVKDIAAARKQLVKRGVKLSEIHAVAPKIKICDGEDPEGNPICLESVGKK